MTKAEAIEAIEIMRSYVGGNKIAFREKGSNNSWNIVTDPNFNFQDYEYRVHLEVVVPWTKDTCPIECGCVLNFVKCAHPVSRIVVELDRENELVVMGNGNVESFRDLYDNYMFMNGQRCGVIKYVGGQND